MKSVKVAVIGCGRWGMNYVRLLTSMPTVSEVVVLDISQHVLDEAKRQFPSIATLCDDSIHADNLLDMAVGAAVVAVPARDHFVCAHRLLDVGINVLVEKPMALKPIHCEELIRLAKAKKCVLMTGHTFLYNAAVQYMKKLIENGAAGDVYYVTSRRTNWGPFRDDVDVLMDLAPHDVSIMNYVLDNVPTHASAVGNHVGVYEGCYGFDVVDVTLDYATERDSGITGHIHVSWCDPQKVRRIEVVGSKAKIVFDDMKAEKVSIYSQAIPTSAGATYGEHQLVHAAGDISIPRIAPSEPLRNLVETFMGHVMNRTYYLDFGGHDVVRTLRAAHESAHECSGRAMPVLP